MLRRLVPFALSAVVASGLVAVIGPAHAETSSVDDVARDVSRVGRDGSGPAGPGERGERSADIRRATLVHGADRVKVVIRVRNLASPEGYPVFASALLRTPDGTVYRVQGGDAEARLSRLGDGGPEAVECAVTTRRSLERDEISYAFDRDCMGAPTWLRFGASTHTDTPMPVWYVDDARREGVYDESQPVRIAGPRVYAGRRQ